MLIPLSRRGGHPVQFAEIDDADAWIVWSRRWRAERVVYRGNVVCVRACTGTGANRVYMHRLLAGADSGVEVDHVDGNGLNNRRSNLRIATHAENMQNRKIHSNNTSGARGVHRDGNKWRAQGRIGGVKHSIGSFPTIEEATAAAIAWRRSTMPFAVER